MENLNETQLEIFKKLLNEALYNLQRHFIDYPNWNKYYDLSSKILNSNDIENYYNLATALMNPKVIEVGENREQYNIQKDTLKENIKRCEEFLNQNALDLNGKSIPELPDMPLGDEKPVPTSAYQDDKPLGDEKPVPTSAYQDDIPDMPLGDEKPVPTSAYQDDIPDMPLGDEKPVPTSAYQDDIPDMPFDYPYHNENNISRGRHR